MTPMTAEAELAVYFSEFDIATKAKVVTDRITGLSHRFGFVTFMDRKVFESGVLEACHFINGSRLKVELQRTHTQSLPIRNLVAEDIQSSINCL
ncbi:unnamed protein product [Dibothriocephalus latus]|uniref:RRM domain-containing protein n=1 Tax=Dibothriocephalus latus TaxID=60516 RepID=A0A3P7NDF6_DIBLA|nr:unnamed protein product [Dibothriocephalus latus]